jgi:DNA repair protein RecN (Recombination protein N)
VAKSIENGTTHTRIERLNEEERIVEIAQMLSGAKTTEAALANARDMLYLN